MNDRTRRAHARLDVTLNVKLQVDDREVKVTCLNISQGGMFLEADHITIGETVNLTFKLPDLPTPITTEARVCWSERESRSGIGVQFVGLRAIEVWAINQLFRRHSRGEL